MGYQVAWEKMALQIKDDGTDTILKRGEYLPDGVDEFTLGVLTSIGAVNMREDPPAEPVAAQPDPADGEPGAPPHLSPEQTGDPAASTNPDGPPATSANKPEWVEYAVSRGLSRPEAERLSKDALINRYGN